LAALGISGAQNVQNPPSPQALFESGRYEQAVAAIAAAPNPSSPEAIYLAGQCHIRLNQQDVARAEFGKLVTVTEPPSAPATWSLVGQSATALVDGNVPSAIAAARGAVDMAPEQFHPNYQLGLALSGAEQWAPAAGAFEKATMLDPAFAYAHYYAGLAYSKVRRVDQMAKHFEYFLRLAPEAPERPAVTALMGSVRGK
jgi:tetratricopeptide (TPR) repeat protein